MSSFIKNIIWCVILISLVVIAFIIKKPEGLFISNPLPLLSRILSIIFLFLGCCALSYTLSDMINFKYKLIIKSYQVEVKYLTVLWLFIPRWKALSTESHSHEVQNLFGAKMDSYYSTDVTYNNEEKAMIAIEKHKKEFKEARKKFFKFNKRKKDKIKYL